MKTVLLKQAFVVNNSDVGASARNVKYLRIIRSNASVVAWGCATKYMKPILKGP